MQITSAAGALAGVHSGDQLFVQGGAATPSVLLDALVARADELRDVSVIHFHTEGAAPHLAPEMAGHFRHKALFIGANARLAVNEGRADYIPVFLSDVPQLFASDTLRLDAVLINVTPPDAHGFCSLGTSVDATLAAVRNATMVIAQLNPRVPRTLGDTFIHVDEIDCGVEVNEPLKEHLEPPIGEAERHIGELVASLVPDGATLQLGIGSIPSAIASALADKRDLGIHSELFTDAILDLVESGALTGARKEVNRGKIVATFLVGTQRLYDFVDDNPLVELRPVDYTNDTAVIRRFSRMMAINSALQIDLSGQV
jgi:acyl-CoA hydrolase